MRRTSEIDDPSWTDIRDRDLLIHFAVKNARPRRGKRVRWAVIRDLFSIGSGSAIELCKSHGIDPNEEIQ